MNRTDLSLFEWSESTILENYRVTFSFYTNILSYLIDKAYPSLDCFYQLIQSSPFVDQVSSVYALYEFIGIRKKEHFLRKLLAITNPNGEVTNISTILNYKNKFSSQDLNYLTVADETIVKVDEELSRIITDFSIDYDSSELHKYLFKPAKDLHLNSRVSKEDCMVTISSVMPNNNDREDFVCLLTNDNDFEESLNENGFIGRIDQAFVDNSITKPNVINIKRVSGLNLTQKIEDKSVIMKVIQTLVIDFIRKKNSHLFIGKTFTDNCSGRPEIVCLELEEERQIPQNPYLTIVGIELDFIFNISVPISSFRKKDGTEVLSYPIKEEDIQDGLLSFKLNELPEDHQYKSVEKFIFSMLRRKGNLIFLST